MDNLTHTLFALTLARTPLARAGRGVTAALVVASNAPDVDVIVAARGQLKYLQWHRGPTHGALGVIGLGVAVGVVVWLAVRARDARWDRGRPATAPASLAPLVAIAIVGVLLHVLMDLPTSYGTRLFSPADWHWFAFDWLPIVDIYLLAVLAAGLMFGSRSAAARRRNAALALVLMAGNYGLRAATHRQALAAASRVFGPLLPPPCGGTPPASTLAVWPRAAATAAGARCLVEMAAMPSFVSPFRWRLIARLSNAYELRDVDLLDPRLLQPPSTGEGLWRVTVRYPNQWAPVVAHAAETEVARIFLGFARFPAARWLNDPETGIVTVRWTDMRFAGGLVRADQLVPSADVFTVTVRLGPDGRILEQRIGR